MPVHFRNAKISLKKRKRLIELVFEEKKSIAKAGRKLCIKPSTAKLIVKKFKETGTFTVKRSDDPFEFDHSQEESVEMAQNNINEVQQVNENENHQSNCPQDTFNGLTYFYTGWEAGQFFAYPFFCQNVWI